MQPSLLIASTYSPLEVSCSVSRTHTESHTCTHTHTIVGDGKVYIWDMSTRDCVHTFYDEGCLLGTKLCVSPDNHYVACGSDSGVVNVYSREQCFISGEESSSLGHNTEHPKPLKSVMNLITGIDSACFNSTR